MFTVRQRGCMRYGDPLNELKKLGSKRGDISPVTLGIEYFDTTPMLLFFGYFGSRHGP